MSGFSKIPSGPVDVCLVDDDADILAITSRTLEKAGFSIVTAGDAASAWEIMNRERPKVVISDWRLPGDDGVALCKRMRQSSELAGTCFVLISGVSEEKLHAEALQAGADDYLPKPLDRSVLTAHVRMGVRMWEVTERLRRAAITDGLTGLFNHDHFTSLVEAELRRTRRYGSQMALVMVDLDYFKAVNDTYGHLAGNDTLTAVAKVLTQCVRDVDTVGRFGGEEFAIIAPGASVESAVVICERIRHAIADHVHLPGLHDHRITASFGVATTDDARVRSAADLVDLADKALYSAKNRGRNCVCTAAEPIEEAMPGIERKEVENLRKQVAVLSLRAKDVYMQSVSSLLQALEEKDPFTARHSANVAFYAEQMARQMGLGESLCISVRNAGLLHDIGKVGIPDRVLLKPTRLSEIESEVMRQVPAISARIIDPLRILESEMHLIRHQSERYDGTGHPDGLRGEQIPIGARILLVANAFDAMTTDRVYRTSRSINEALEVLQLQAGEQFDPRAVLAMETLIEARRDDIRGRIRETADVMRIPVGAV
ncbi:MAG: diguanylate cyclase [Phycisphaerales bacterium]|nr:diguanylate cyclase [Phycisphaerales bacterium]